MALRRLSSLWINWSKLSPSIVYTIEGNSGDKIAKLSYEKNSPYIMGYGTP